MTSTIYDPLFSSIVCPQLNELLNGTQTLDGQEDCLMVNVYVPKSAIVDPNLKLPVMFWIHGGSLLRGSNRYREFGPQCLIDHEVIIVTVNYRLGPLGFLSLGNETVPGNAGFR